MEPAAERGEGRATLQKASVQRSCRGLTVREWRNTRPQNAQQFGGIPLKILF